MTRRETDRIEWTAENIDLLRKWWEVEGLPLNEIARRLDTTRNSIAGKVWRLHLQTPTSPPKAFAPPSWHKKWREPISPKAMQPQPQSKPISPKVIQPQPTIWPKQRECWWVTEMDTLDNPHFCRKTVMLGQNYCTGHIARVWLELKFDPNWRPPYRPEDQPEDKKAS